MNRLRCLLVLISVLCAVTAVACSKEKSSKDEAKNVKPVTEQAKEAIQDYGRRPVAAAQKTQSLGDERLNGIDEAMKDIEKR